MVWFRAGILFVLAGFCLVAWAQETFRKFTTTTGQAFTGRVLSYEGRTFYFQGKDGKLYPVPYDRLSTPDKAYLIKLVQEKKLPKGKPQTAKPPVQNGKEDDPSSQTGSDNAEKLKPPPPPKPQFRPGSFFSYIPVPLGQDPAEALAHSSTDSTPQEVGETSADAGGMPGPDEPIDFEKHLMPMIEESCLDCHGAPYVKNGRTIPPKAGLRLDSHEWIIKGNLDGAIVSPGSLDESTLYQVITLDPDDPEIMPPKGEPWDDEQISVLERWILEGAKPRPGAASLATTSKPAESNTEPDPSVSRLDVIGKKVRPASRPQLEAAMKSGALVSPLSEKHSLVRVEFSSAAYQTTDSDLSLFSNLKNNISHLDLSKTKISDQALGTVQGYRNLVWLSLRNTQIGDRGLESLAKMEELTYINLVGTKVTDKGLESLSLIKSLEEVYLWNSKVSEKGVENLRNTLPEVKIIF